MTMTDQIPDGAPMDRYYRHFSLDTDEDEASAKFVKLYGQPPEYIFPYKFDLWVGPVPSPTLPGNLEEK